MHISVGVIYLAFAKSNIKINLIDGQILKYVTLIQNVFEVRGILFHAIINKCSKVPSIDL